MQVIFSINRLVFNNFYHSQTIVNQILTTKTIVTIPFVLPGFLKAGNFFTIISLSNV